MKKILSVIIAVLFIGLANGQTLLIYGGSNHDVYLGKLNASRYDSESIWNEYGRYGSKYNSNSIWNEYGSNPPVLVDSQGNFYGYFTANRYRPKRANFDLVNIICEYHEKIREDVGEWYDKIF